MQRLRELARRVEAVYGEMADTFSLYQQQHGLGCQAGCGECCLSPSIEATVLEVLPLALYLFDQGKAEQTLTQLEALAEPQSCFFYQRLSFDGRQGQCSVYLQRPSICRMFGVAGYRNKQGQKSVSVCKVIKANHPLAYQQTLIALESDPPPMMLSAQEEVNQLDYDMGKQFLPINDAIKQALEKVLFKAWYGGFNDDQQIA